MSRDLYLIAAALFTWGIGEGSFLYFEPLYLEKLGASSVAIGSILGAVGVAMSLAHIPAGHLSDRVGRRAILWVSWVAGGAAAWLMALSRSLPTFVAGLLLYSLTAFVMSPLNSYITAARGKLSVGRAITLISAAYNLGAVIGPLIGGVIGERYQMQRIFLFAAVTFLISNLIIFNIRSQPIEIREVGDGNGIKGNRPFLIYQGVLLVTMFALYMPQPLTPNFLQNQRGLSLSTIGQIGAAGSLGNVVLNLTIGRLNAFHGFLLGQVSVSLFALMIWQGIGLPWYVGGYFLLGGFRVARSLAIAQVRDLVDQANMGLAYGITETVLSAGLILVAPIAGFLYDWRPASVYPLSMAMIALAFTVSLRFLPRPGDR